MTLKSALQDVKETTLAAVAGLLGKLAYLASLRAQGRYEHWGMEVVHGPESSERALKAAHAEVLAGVLRTPLPSLVEDLERSSSASGVAAQRMSRKCATFDDLLPQGTNSPAQTTLVQCCWRFRVWRGIEGVPLGQLHSHSHDLAQDFRFLWVPQNSDWNRR